MPNAIIMPKFGQMTEESAIVEWRKKEGDTVAKGEVLFTVETDKSVMEAESFFEGTLLKILVQPGVNVPVQSTVGFIGQPGEAIPPVAAPAPRPAAGAAPTPQPQPAAARPEPRSPTVGAAPTRSSVPSTIAAEPAVFRISPRAKALVQQAVIHPQSIRGSGPNGRIVEKDVVAYLQAKGYDELRISPAAKNLAAREQIDLLSVAPSDGGRISVADIERAVK
jgi:pyruvate dehydrogenase E2 component (dihydrolipoamide acetyltransferase)